MNYSADIASHSVNPSNSYAQKSVISGTSRYPQMVVNRTLKQQRAQQVSTLSQDVRHVTSDLQSPEYSNCFNVASSGRELRSSEGKIAPYDNGVSEDGRRNANHVIIDGEINRMYSTYGYPVESFEQCPTHTLPRSHNFQYDSRTEYYPRSKVAVRHCSTPPPVSEKSELQALQTTPQENPYANTRKGFEFPISGYTELDSTFIPPHELHHRIDNADVDNDKFVRFRDPDLKEVIEFLKHNNNTVKANAAAYLQHLCYMDNQMKNRTRSLGGILPLVALLNSEIPEVHRNACGALRNLSYGRENDDNKREITKANGIPSLMRLLRKTPDNEVRELVTGILWNLSSCEDLKTVILDECHSILISYIIIPHSGWDKTHITIDHQQDVYWSTVFRNSSGVLRNISSAGEYARRKLRECPGLVDSLLFLVRAAFGNSNIDNKSVENCVCILRNLSYRCQEVEDPNYDHHSSGQNKGIFLGKENDTSGCFGSNKKKKEPSFVQKDTVSHMTTASSRNEPIIGMELLWQPEVVQPYLTLLTDCSNPETLEAAAGCIQNLAACYWQPSADIRAAVRKEKGLPILVELLRMDVDKVVCAVATALRNLAIDQRNKELIGKYAMRDLVNRLPTGNIQHDQNTSDQTVCAVLATLNEVIRKNPEFSRSLYELGGVDRLVSVNRQRTRYSPKVVRFASQVLQTMWQHQELRDTYRRGGWKEQDFVCKSVSGTRSSSIPRSGSPVTANNTLNRPISSQGGTRYEDLTLQRPHHASNDLQLSDMNCPDGGHMTANNMHMYSNKPPKAGEPVYAQVHRGRRKLDIWEANESVTYNSEADATNHPIGDSWV